MASEWVEERRVLTARRGSTYIVKPIGRVRRAGFGDLHVEVYMLSVYYIFCPIAVYLFLLENDHKFKLVRA